MTEAQSHLQSLQTQLQMKPQLPSVEKNYFQPLESENPFFPHVSTTKISPTPTEQRILSWSELKTKGLLLHTNSCVTRITTADNC